MSFKAYAPPLILGGTVNSFAFLKLSKVADRTLLQAGLNDPPFAISQEGPNAFQLLSSSLNPAGIAGQPIEFFMDGEPCKLLVGAGGWNRGDFLMSDANGAGITGIVGTNNIGAIAMSTEVAGAYGKVVPFLQYAAGASGSSGAIRSVTANTTLTAADAGTFVLLTLATSGTVTLPPVATLVPGARFTLVSAAIPGSGAGALFSINGSDAAYIYGNGFTSPTAGSPHGALNTRATAQAGDLFGVVFDGANFLADRVIGTWAKA